MTIFIVHIELVCCRGTVRCRIGWLLLLGRELRQEVEKMVLSKQQFPVSS